MLLRRRPDSSACLAFVISWHGGHVADLYVYLSAASLAEASAPAPALASAETFALYCSLVASKVFNCWRAQVPSAACGICCCCVIVAAAAAAPGWLAGWQLFERHTPPICMSILFPKPFAYL